MMALNTKSIGKATEEKKDWIVARDEHGKGYLKMLNSNKAKKEVEIHEDEIEEE